MLSDVSSERQRVVSQAGVWILVCDFFFSIFWSICARSSDLIVITGGRLWAGVQGLNRDITVMWWNCV